MTESTASEISLLGTLEEISRLVNPKNMDVLLVDAHRVTHWDLTALEAFKRMADVGASPARRTSPNSGCPTFSCRGLVSTCS